MSERTVCYMLRRFPGPRLFHARCAVTTNLRGEWREERVRGERREESGERREERGGRRKEREGKDGGERRGRTASDRFGQL